MKKQITLRQKAERARRKAMPIALIQKPLRFIGENDSYRVLQKDGMTAVLFGPRYKEAKVYADKGLGRLVQLVARTIAA